jgi:hypothetical protein
MAAHSTPLASMGAGAEASSCIEISMRRLRMQFILLPLILAACAALLAGTPGSFRGTIVDAPQSGTGKNWIYVQGRNGTARRVEISRADVSYDEDVPEANRVKNPSQALVPGAEVRVTAEQGSDGEWTASTIEILKAAVSGQQSAFSNKHSAIEQRVRR